jgi:hypothetical protein
VSLGNFSSFADREEICEICDLCGLATGTDAFGDHVSMGLWGCKWMLLGPDGYQFGLKSPSAQEQLKCNIHDER